MKKKSAKSPKPATAELKKPEQSDDRGTISDGADIFTRQEIAEVVIGLLPILEPPAYVAHLSSKVVSASAQKVDRFSAEAFSAAAKKAVLLLKACHDVSSPKAQKEILKPLQISRDMMASEEEKASWPIGKQFSHGEVNTSTLIRDAAGTGRSLDRAIAKVISLIEQNKSVTPAERTEFGKWVRKTKIISDIQLDPEELSKEDILRKLWELWLGEKYCQKLKKTGPVQTI